MIHEPVSLVPTSPMASELTLHSSGAVPLGFLKRCLNIKCLLLDVWVVSRPGLDPRFLTCELQSRMGGPALLHKGSSDSAIPPEVGGRRSSSACSRALCPCSSRMGGRKEGSEE